MIRSCTGLLSTSDQTIDIMEFIFSPDLHGPLDLGVDVDEPEMPKKFGNRLDSEFVMEVMGSID